MYWDMVYVSSSASGGSSGPPGREIALLSNINGMYVTADTSNGGQLVANSFTVGTAQLFNVVSEGGNNFALLSQANNLYVSANLNDSDFLQAGFATSAGTWETFTWDSLTNGNFAIFSPASSYYVSTNQSNNSYLQAGFATSVGTWEQYQYVDEGPAQ